MGPHLGLDNLVYIYMCSGAKADKHTSVNVVRMWCEGSHTSAHIKWVWCEGCHTSAHVMNIVL